VRTVFFALVLSGLVSLSARADFIGAYAVPSPFAYNVHDGPASFSVGTWTFVDSHDLAFGNPLFYGNQSQLNFDTSSSLATQFGHTMTMQLTHSVVDTGILSFTYTITFPGASMFSHDQAG
jgi:hypothetical protein